MVTRSVRDSASVVMGTVVVDTLNDPVPLTREEVITKFGLSENNPIPVIKKPRKKAGEPVE